MFPVLPHLLLIAVAGAITYLGALGAGFLSIDDISMLSSVTTGSPSLRELFLGGGSEYYRPLAVLSYAANVMLSGRNAEAFHAVNIGVHILNASLVYYLAVSLFADNGKKHTLALISALFFLLHPLNTEAVIWISARPDLLCTFFFLLALILLSTQRENYHLPALFLLFIAIMGSLWSKEAALSIFAIVPLFLFLDRKRFKGKDAAYFLSALIVSFAVYVLLRSGGKPAVIDRGIASVVAGVAAPASSHPSLLDAAAAYGFYLRKLVWPFPLNFTLLSFDKPAALIALGLALPVAYLLLRRHVILLLPALVIFAGIVPPVMAYLGNIPWTPLGERYLYLPMIGFSLVVGFISTRSARIPVVIPLAFVLLLAVPTIERVGVWSDPKAFWNDALQKSPQFAKSYSALGVAAFDEGDYALAERHMQKAIDLGFNRPVIWQNLGKIYAARKEFGKYETVMLEAALRSPTPAAVYQEMILTLSPVNYEDDPFWGYKKAIHYNLKALEKDPDFTQAHYNVGKLYMHMGDYTNAHHHLKTYADVAIKEEFRPFALKMIEKIKSAERSTARSLALKGSE